ncbi:putative GABA permease [Aspergillus steynii IBT 23096]|uniref:Putative GABA permease n=1 Tax=Aspergillus steynii IBT 23096 TaxID=1392250 RepID=A0A2I2FRW6_9EURO|nr:putative GABA permease [Aspergillus steynii IBT 23096]PLB43361.1 putative GABA permease [Aspergillus steynii IBT 23096]
MADNDENQKVFASSTGEDARLEHLGYEQELKRTFGLLGMIGFSFSVVTSWTALSGVFIVGVKSGGPPVMVFSFIAVCFLTLAVAIPMAEMCSMYPVAGGQYSWVAALAPPRIARGLSYISGWFMLIGILAMGATNNSIGANFILGMANLVFPEYTIQRWQTVLVAYLVAFVSASVNIWGPHLLNRIARFILIWNVGSFLITMITLLATNDNKQPASFVFHDFQNFTGWGSSMAAIVGILQACFGMCCYDAPSHMTEEMKSASKEAPKAIILSVVLGAVTGFAFLLTLCFCIGDIDSTANTSTGVPVIQIFYDSTGSKVGTCFLASMIAVIVLVAGNNLLAEGSRSVYAFARDHGLPFSSVLSKVDPKRQVPVNAVLLTLAVQLALDAIDFGTTTGFETVIAISTEGFYVSYAIALSARLLGHVTSHNPTMKGPFALPTCVSIALNILGLLFLLFAAITFNFPTSYPVSHDSMNYTSAAVGVIALIAVVTWVVTARKRFTGPPGVSVLDGCEDVGQNNAGGYEDGEKGEKR